MKVNLINYTGFGHYDKWFAARLLVYTKSTRLEQGEETRRKIFIEMSVDDIKYELDYIARTIRSSWEFVDYTFEITGVTRAFTHQFVRTRTGSYAQQAQRVADMSDFDAVMPQTVFEGGQTARAAWENMMTAIRIGYKQLRALNIPAQDARGVLPTNVCTNIIAKFNLRTMADLLAKRKNLRAQGEYASVALEMESLILDVHPWAKQFLAPDRLQTPNLDAILREALGKRGPTEMPQVNAALKELDALKGTWG